MRAERACVYVSPRCVHTDLGPPGPSPLLAEALLEQAMIGPSPNPLILSYLKYAISSQVTTLPALPPRLALQTLLGVTSQPQLAGGQGNRGAGSVAGRHPNLPSVSPLSLGGRWRAQCVPKAGVFL